MRNLIKAFILMCKSHYKHKDKGGKPYIFHPLTVAIRVKGYDEKIVALLHDVIEDTDTRIEDIKFLNDKQREALLLVTHNEDESYQHYIEKIKQNPIAKAVKLEDLKHNTDISRIKNPNSDDFKRTNKYLMYYQVLKNTSF